MSTYKTLNICPCANKKILYNIFILQACAACLDSISVKLIVYFLQKTFVPRNFLLIIANNIIPRWCSDIIVQVTKTEKEWWNAMKIMRVLSEKKWWNAMKMIRILSPSPIIWASDDLRPIQSSDCTKSKDVLQVAKISFWSQKKRNILKLLQNQFSDFFFQFSSNKNFHFKILGL